MNPDKTARLWQRVASVYAKALSNEQQVLEALKTHKLDDATMLETLQVGFCNGSLSNLLPKAGDILKGLRGIGLLNEANEEVLRGCITVPLLDAAGNPYGFWGTCLEGTELKELYVPAAIQGVFNRTAAKMNKTVLVAGRILDVLSLWQAGFRNALAFFGTEPTAELLEELFRGSQVCEVVVCSGSCHPTAASAAVDHGLRERIKTVRSIQLPSGVPDVHHFLLRHTAQEFQRRLDLTEHKEPSSQTKSAEDMKVAAWGFEVCYENRKYEVRAIEKPSPSRLKATIRALGERGRFVIDTIDFYFSRSRRSFMCESARLFRQPLDVIEGDINRITEQLEEHIKRQLDERSTRAISISEDDRAEGMKLGRSPDLVNEIVRDVERLGMVGERINKLVAYLTMTSRKLPEPLALLILSGSGAGKSHLQDSILALCPEEDVIKLTSLTEHALFYKAEHSLRHKVLAIEELAGAKGADYAIRNLISARKLVIETTVRNPLTGKLETQVNTVQGPTAIFQTTTNPRTDAETRSRFILVSVDESPEQTRAILQNQRQSHTLEGLCRVRSREQILRRHHAFQRLLRPLLVVNPFEPLLAYPEEYLLVRRDHPKYLNLILTVAFLHQLQRPVRHHPQIGEFVEVTLGDIAIANELVHQLFGHSLDDLSPPARELLHLVSEYLKKRAASEAADKTTFQRRELREALKWSDTRLRTHLRELVEMEHLVPLSGRCGVAYRYRLVEEPDNIRGKHLSGLKSVEELRRESHLAGLCTDPAATPPVQNEEAKTKKRTLKPALVAKPAGNPAGPSN